jgi:hypothetical protein
MLILTKCLAHNQGYSLCMEPCSITFTSYIVTPIEDSLSEQKFKSLQIAKTENL